MGNDVYPAAQVRNTTEYSILPCNYRVLSGERTITAYTPKLYAPHLPAVATSSKVRTLKEIADLKQIENLASTVQAHHVESNLDALIHFHSTQTPHPNSLDCYTPIIISVGTVTLLYILYHLAYSYVRKMLRFKIKQTPEAIHDSSVTDSQQAAKNTEPGILPVEPSPQIRFVKHPLTTA
jgi:hypothetical protein